MKLRTLTRTFVLALMVIAALTVTFSIVSGQDAEENQSSSSSNARQRTIEGVWRQQLTPRNCQTGEPLVPFTIPGLITYHKGGTLSETHVTPHLSPLSRSLGHGVWNRKSRRHYDNSFLFQVVNPDGSFAGTTRINGNIELDASGDRWVANATFQILDANDNVIQTGCGTAVGTRFE